MNYISKYEIPAMNVFQGEELGLMKATVTQLLLLEAESRVPWESDDDTQELNLMLHFPFQLIFITLSSTSSQSCFFFLILTRFGIFKETDCSLYIHSTFHKPFDTERLSIAQTRVTIGLILPLASVPHLSVWFCWLVPALVLMLIFSLMWLFLLEVDGF